MNLLFVKGVKGKCHHPCALSPLHIVFVVVVVVNNNVENRMKISLTAFYFEVPEIDIFSVSLIKFELFVSCGLSGRRVLIALNAIAGYKI